MTSSCKHVFSVIFGVVLMLTLGRDAGLAQGSTGGSIGNDNKSLSGGSGDAPRSAAPARRAKPERREPAPRREAAPRRGGDDGGGVAKFNGTWSVTSVGITCTDTLTITSTISNGRITSANDSGTITPNGAISTIGNYSGITVTAQGRASANAGSGTFRRSDGCTGRWSSRKQ